MAKILLIISALVIAATAYLGFATKQKVDGIQEDLKKNRRELQGTSDTLKKTQGTLKTTETDLIAARSTIEERDKAIAQKTGEIDKATADVTKLTTDLAAKTDELDKIKARLGGEKPIDVDGMVAEVSRLKEEIKTLTGDLLEKTQLVETLNNQKKETDTQLASEKRTVAEYKQGFVRPGLSGTILAYNPGWNFVVLSLGDKHGLKANARLVVRRGGQMIGKVKVTTVEPSTSIADIVPGSVPKGMSVQPGDSVIFEGRTE
jgi:hypothetical protein